MSWEKPQIPVVWMAIEAYLRAAYEDKPPPAAVTQRVAALRDTPANTFFDSALLERDDAKPHPTRYALRLGNKHYPHMKLVVERSPDGRSHLFRADTHDRHIRPAPGCKEYDAFSQLMRMNQQAAERIEAEWAQAGVPTFKSYLRRDLASRQQQGTAPRPDAAPGPSSKTS
jgi:hypothetical protein